MAQTPNRETHLQGITKPNRLRCASHRQLVKYTYQGPDSMLDHLLLVPLDLLHFSAMVPIRYFPHRLVYP